MTPAWGLLWSEAGGDGWACVGLYATRGEAMDAFDLWTHTRAGQLVMVAMDEMEHRDLDPYREDMAEKIAGPEWPAHLPRRDLSS